MFSLQTVLLYTFIELIFMLIVTILLTPNMCFVPNRPCLMTNLMCLYLSNALKQINLGIIHSVLIVSFPRSFTAHIKFPIPASLYTIEEKTEICVSNHLFFLPVQYKWFNKPHIITVFQLLQSKHANIDFSRLINNKNSFQIIHTK